jgi:hypothetical protein
MAQGQRRLAAILVAHIVGYSALVAGDEALARAVQQSCG